MLFSLKQIPIPEIVRYALGTALPSPIPQEFLSLAQNAAQEVLSCCQPKYHLVRYPVQPLLDSFLTGEDIRRHLSGCSDCVLLCATLGSEVDALIRRTQVTDMAKTLWLDAAASAAIEQVCDEVQLDIAQRLERKIQCTGAADGIAIGVFVAKDQDIVRAAQTQHGCLPIHRFGHKAPLFSAAIGGYSLSPVGSGLWEGAAASVNFNCAFWSTTGCSTS